MARPFNAQPTGGGTNFYQYTGAAANVSNDGWNFQYFPSGGNFLNIADINVSNSSVKVQVQTGEWQNNGRVGVTSSAIQVDFTVNVVVSRLDITFGPTYWRRTVAQWTGPAANAVDRLLSINNEPIIGLAAGGWNNTVDINNQNVQLLPGFSMSIPFGQSRSIEQTIGRKWLYVYMDALGYAPQYDDDYWIDLTFTNAVANAPTITARHEHTKSDGFNFEGSINNWGSDTQGFIQIKWGNAVDSLTNTVRYPASGFTTATSYALPQITGLNSASNYYYQTTAQNSQGLASTTSVQQARTWHQPGAIRGTDGVMRSFNNGHYQIRKTNGGALTEMWTIDDTINAAGNAYGYLTKPVSPVRPSIKPSNTVTRSKKQYINVPPLDTPVPTATVNLQSVTVSWPSVTGATTYSYTVTAGAIGYTYIGTTSSPSFTLNNLSPSDDYTVIVLARSATNSSSFGTTTWTISPATLGDPSNLTLSLSGLTITATWAAAAGADFYNVEVTDASGNFDSFYIVNGTTFNFDATELTTDETWTFTVTAEQFDGTTSNSITDSILVPAVIDTIDYFTIKSIDETTPITITPRVTNSALTLQYSTDGASWTNIASGAALPAAPSIKFRGVLDTSGSSGTAPEYSLFSDHVAGNAWQVSGADFTCSGDMTTLLDYLNPPLALGANCFAYMFYGQSRLKQPFTLPSVGLSSYSYFCAFRNTGISTPFDVSMYNTMSPYCFGAMMMECYSLTTPPTLPATVLDDNCYYRMFYGCTALTSCPALPATTLANACYREMFGNCSSITTPPQLNATNLATNCYESMFNGCTALTSVCALPANTLYNNCYINMFNGCSNLSVLTDQTSTNGHKFRIPTSGSFQWDNGNIAIGAYTSSGMFANTKNNTMQSYSAGTPVSGAVLWVENPVVGGDSTATPYFYLVNRQITTSVNSIDQWSISFPNTINNSISFQYSYDAVTWYNMILHGNYNFSTWPAIFIRGSGGTGSNAWLHNSPFTGGTTYSIGVAHNDNVTPDGIKYGAHGDIRLLLDYQNPPSSIQSYAFYNLFGMDGTPSSSYTYVFYAIEYAPNLPFSSVPGSAYYGMFGSCEYLLKPPALPATTLTGQCYTRMFQGCIRLNTLPQLPATTLVNAGYAEMFSGCSGLNISTTSSGSNTYAFRIPSSGTGTDAVNSRNNMFQGVTGGAPATPSLNTNYYTNRQPIAS